MPVVRRAYGARTGDHVGPPTLIGRGADYAIDGLDRVHDDGVLICIEAFDLPGRECGRAPGFPGYSNIHVGVQRRERTGELLGMTAADVSSVMWELEVTATRTESGWDLHGPFVQGRPGGRFVYLSWGTVDGAGAFAMFRRAKLWLEAIPAEVLERAVAGGALIARLGLTDAKGQPLCASVRPPLVEWSTPTG